MARRRDTNAKRSSYNHQYYLRNKQKWARDKKGKLSKAPGTLVVISGPGYRKTININSSIVRGSPEFKKIVADAHRKYQAEAEAAKKKRKLNDTSYRMQEAKKAKADAARERAMRDASRGRGKAAAGPHTNAAKPRKERARREKFSTYWKMGASMFAEYWKIGAKALIGASKNALLKKLKKNFNTVKEVELRAIHQYETRYKTITTAQKFIEKLTNSEPGPNAKAHSSHSSSSGPSSKPTTRRIRNNR